MALSNTRFIRRDAAGFTLIELMIVMSIVALTLSLVGPLAIDSLDKARARSELVTLKNWMRYQSHKAFINGYDRQFLFVNKRILTIERGSQKEVELRRFDYLTFPSQRLDISKRGIASRDKIDVMIGERKESLDTYNWKNDDTSS